MWYYVKIEDINSLIIESKLSGEISTKEISDGHHTFGELYRHRIALFCTLCNLLSEISWKSKKHFDEEKDPMFNGDFIAGINTPQRPATYHIKLEYWDLFNVIEIERAYPYDGHTSDEDLIRQDGCFITPNGEIVNGFGCHEGYAANHIRGSEYNSITEFIHRYKSQNLYYPGEDKEIFKHYNIEKIEDLNPYISSFLSQEDINKYIKWQELVLYDDAWEVYWQEMNSIFLNRFLRYDKLETIRRQTITTTTPFMHLRFFEYFVMGYNIDSVCFFYFDENGEIQYKDPAYDKYPGWIKDFHANERCRETINRINNEKWSYEARIEYIKTYKKKL